jgi:GT2 family glycosyltransferase
MGAERVRAALILVCHHSSDVLPECIRSFRSEAIRAEVEAEVVVVEQSDDAAEASAVGAMDVDQLVVRPNTGYAAGLNAGIRSSSGDIVLLANPDIRFLDGSLKPLLEGLGDDCDVVGPQLVWDASGEVLFPPAEDPAPSAELVRAGRRRWRRAWRAGLAEWVESVWRVWTAAGTVPVPALRGPLLVLSRPTLKALGALDEGYFLYYEETEWLWRARRRGSRLGVVGSSRVAHHWGHSTAKLRDRDQVEADSRARFFSRNYSPAWRRLLGWVARDDHRIGVEGDRISGPEDLPEVAADVWLISTFRHLQPSVGAVRCEALPKRLVEITSQGEWFALAAARVGGSWKPLGEWTWNRP